MTQQLPIPATILTGFLGAGKTTLINALLSSDYNERILVVENEFGPVNIDSALINRNNDIEVVELTNGCICCSVRGELTANLLSLLEKREQGLIFFDRIILETTGVADPAPIIQTFFIDELLRSRFQLDAVITLVDSEHGQKQLNEHRVVTSQVGFADRLLLTKLDRVTSQEKEQLIDRLRKINAKAAIYDCEMGNIPANLWLNIQAFNLSNELEFDSAFSIRAQPLKPNTRFIPLNHQQGLLTQSWSDDIQSFVLEAMQLDQEPIGKFMESLINDYGNDMLRYKGIIAIKNQAHRLIIQGVHNVVGFDYGQAWSTQEIPQTTVVIIGRNLPIMKIKEQFSQLADESRQR